MTFLENVDKTKLQKITLIVISALVLTALALLLVIILMSITPKTPGLSAGLSNLEDYTVTDSNVNTGTLILADSNHTYLPKAEWLGLVNCAEYMTSQPDATGTQPKPDGKKDYENMNYIPWTAMKLSDKAMPYVHKMLTDAKKAVGKLPITIDGAYDVVKHGEQYPEYSTALLILLSDFESDGTTRVPLKNEYREWLDANAYKYGFIESFEDGYRYVGAPHAKLINDNEDISTLADYIAFLKENTGYDKTVRVKVDGVEYAIYYVECKAGDTIKAPKDLKNTTISGTNEGGVIVTVKLSK